MAIIWAYFHYLKYKLIKFYNYETQSVFMIIKKDLNIFCLEETQFTSKDTQTESEKVRVRYFTQMESKRRHSGRTLDKIKF